MSLLSAQARQAAAPVNLSPAAASIAKVSPLQILIAIEGEALAANDRLSLKHIAVNRPRALIKTGHIIWVARRGHDMQLSAISSQAKIDRTTPFAQWIRAELSARARLGTLDRPAQWQFKSRREGDAFAYPFTEAYFAPFSPDPKAGGLLFTRDGAFTEKEAPQIERLAQIFGTCAAAMGRKKRPRMSLKKRNVLLGTTLLLALASVIPVPMSTLAPAEIVASDPFVITAPIDGVVESILVRPNAEITEGTLLLRLVDTTYRNEYILAGQEQSVADAKLRQASLASFIDNDAKRGIALAKAEKAMASARQDYARDRLSKTEISAPKAGLAIYSDPTDWAGRPVATGEAIIQIADPAKIILRIDAPLSIGETLKRGARVRMFMDSDPLRPLEAKITTASYYTQATPDGHMAYEVFASLSGGAQKGSADVPRIGTRGVAKIYGETAPLGFWLLRRPITIVRQFIGV
jgi:hypothetical protein